MYEEKNDHSCYVRKPRFLPDELVLEARKDIEELFAEFDLNMVALPATASKNGSVETWAHSKACAELFKNHREEIEGVLICMPTSAMKKAWLIP